MADVSAVSAYHQLLPREEQREQQGSSASQEPLGATGIPWKSDLSLWRANREHNMAEGRVSVYLLILRARTAQEALRVIPCCSEIASSPTLNATRFLPMSLGQLSRAYY